MGQMGAAAGTSLVSPELEKAFPGLRATSYEVTSPPDPRYNCIAWAAGDQSLWWEPIRRPPYTWPSNVPFEFTLSALAKSFIATGYAKCESDVLEPGFEKVALFTDEVGNLKHAARQVASGQWTSKLGQNVDIEHDLRGLEGDEYGCVELILKRPCAAPSTAED